MKHKWSKDYPDTPLKKQVRPYSQTLSVWDVVKKTFWPEQKREVDMKQVIVIRKDLKMRRGKEIAQGCHACMKATLENMDHPDVKEWLAGIFKKIVVIVNSEEELLEIHQKAKDAGLVCSLIKDAGLTEFGGEPTYTTVAVGPAMDEKVDVITGHLKLY